MDELSNYFTFQEIRGLIWHAEKGGRDGQNIETKNGIKKLKALLPEYSTKENNANSTSKPTTSRKGSPSVD